MSHLTIDNCIPHYKDQTVNAAYGNNFSLNCSWNEKFSDKSCRENQTAFYVQQLFSKMPV